MASNKKGGELKMKTAQEILNWYDKRWVQLEGRDYDKEMTFLSALLQIREDIHFIAEATALKMRKEEKDKEK